MTEPAAAPPPTAPVPDDPRRLVLADLVGGLVSGLMEQAAEYERAASSAAGALRQSLEDLYRAKQAEIAALAPLARDLGVTAAAPPPPSGPRSALGGRPGGGVSGGADPGAGGAGARRRDGGPRHAGPERPSQF